MPQFQILNKSPGFGEQIGAGLGQGVGEGISSQINKYLQQKQNKSALEGLKPFMEQLEFTPDQMEQFVNSGVPAQIAGPLIGQIGQQFAAQKNQERKLRTEVVEKQAPIKQGLSVLNRQRMLLEKGNLGPKISFNPNQESKLSQALSKEGQKDRAEYQRLGKSLISLSSNIPIRNKQEFETLAESLFDVSMTEAEMEGTLDAMERILKNQLDEPSADEQSIKKEENSIPISEEPGLKKQQPGTKLSREKAAEILKMAKNDPERARKIARQMGYEF